MALWDGLKALFYALLAVALVILAPLLLSLAFAALIAFIIGALVVGYVAYKKEERAEAKEFQSRQRSQ